MSGLPVAHPSQTWLVHLPRDVCEMLLRTSPVGRLGVVVDGRPEVFPICHVFEGGCVAFPTNVGTKLHAALRWPWVCYEIDGMSADNESAWSVIVSGRAEVVSDPRELRLAAALRMSPWRTGDDVVWMRIVPSAISGRRIEADRSVRP